METQALSSMNRRGFLRRAGLGAIALGSVPVLAETLATRAFADEETTTGFIFAAVRLGPTTDGHVPQAAKGGGGTQSPSNVRGGGGVNPGVPSTPARGPHARVARRDLARTP